MVVLLLTAFAGVAFGQFSGGVGTPDDPYEINNATDLYNVRSYPSSHFRQIADVTLSGDWTPIPSFSGVYDGAHHKILNLSITRTAPDTHQMGLFGQLGAGAQVRNLVIESGEVSVTGTGSSMAGALVGTTFGAGVIIENVVSKIPVTGYNNVGGLVGFLYGTEASPAILRDSYAWGAVTGRSGGNVAGGLVGFRMHANVVRCYAAGSVSGSASVGGLIGAATGSGAVTSSFWDTEASGRSASPGGGAGLTSAQMRQHVNFPGWDFEEVWQLYANKSYPYLRAQAETIAPLDFDPPGGPFPGSNVVVTVGSATPDVTIHYTFETRHDPDAFSPEAPPDGRIIVPVTGRLAAVAWKPYWNPSPVRADDYREAPRTAAPVFTPGGGQYTGTVVTVTLTCETSDARLVYTLDGSDPDPEADPVADGATVAIPLATNGITLRARAFRDDLNPGDITTAVYTAAPTVADPVLEPPGGPQPGGMVTVELTCVTDGSLIYYTTNGLDPGPGSLFVGPGNSVLVPVPGTLKAQAYRDNWNPSAVVTGLFTTAESVARPTLDPPGGSYPGTNLSVTIASATAGATIRYTLGGGTTNSLESGAVIAVPLSGDPVELRAWAEFEGLNPSPTTNGLYAWSGQAAMPVFHPPAAPDGVTNLTVTMTSATADALIHYTLDGSVPGPASGSVRDGESVVVPVPGTLRAAAWAPGLDPSAVRTVYYGGFAGGTGSRSDPYLVAIAAQLDNVRGYPTNHFRLIADIDLGVSPWNEGAGWSPIGTFAVRFAGSFDGNGHRIRELTINRPGQDDIGLFGVVDDNGRIFNLGISSGSVEGRHYVGGLAGDNRGSISNCFAHCRVTGYGDGASGGTGGLVGFNSIGSIHNSFATNSVSGTGYLGGLVGRVGGPAARLVNCYAAGPVSAVTDWGGLVGGSNLLGVTGSFWDIQTSGLTASAGGTGTNTAAMKQAATFAGWDFETVWRIDEGLTYPYLKVLADTVALPVFSPDGGVSTNRFVEVTVTCATAGAIIRYTTNGSIPTVSSPIVVSGDRVTVEIPGPGVSGILKARAWNTGMLESEVAEAHFAEQRVATPALDPPGGPLTGLVFRVTVTCATADATIRYTTDGSEPDAASPPVPENGIIEVPNVPEPLVLAKAWKTDWLTSLTATGAYFAAGTVAMPAFDPPGGQYPDAVLVVGIESATAGATIRYTIDGTDPTPDTGWIVPPDGLVSLSLPVTLKARAWKLGMNPSAVREAVYGDFAGGDGSADNPFRIATAQQLDATRRYLEGWSFRLTADIDLATSAFTNWVPVGTYANPFNGDLDGNGHVIRNLVVNRPSLEDVGLIGFLGASGKLRNLGILGGSVSGRYYAGGLAGWVEGVVSNCFTTCSVQTVERISGGLVGGISASARVRNAYATGAVSGDTEVGGLIGRSAGFVSDCFSYGFVSGNGQMGGLIGQFAGGTVTGAYWDTQRSGQSKSAAGIGKTSAELRRRATFTGWDFEEVWNLHEDLTYPFLRDLSVGGGDERLRGWLDAYYPDVAAAPDFVTKQGRIMSMQQVFIAGLDPTDPESVFAARPPVAVGASLTVTVDSVSGRRYRVQTRDLLDDGDWQAAAGVAEQAGTGEPLSFTLPVPPGGGFYRVLVRLVP